ncbi:hypothetical protein LOAG_17139 [Loa loa]|uniref:Uncharacterized protein n=1 Tax=Loa loa TaxID=7209 RepID=A0A1S0UJM0_LOALO|nr:hypothetical protein LOAG_17139 [Loa loa]EJD75775.1 hypothetical protein LOAG_17139 [Loa loa]
MMRSLQTGTDLRFHLAKKKIRTCAGNFGIFVRVFWSVHGKSKCSFVSETSIKRFLDVTKVWDV